RVDRVANDTGFPHILLLEMRAGVAIVAHRMEGEGISPFEDVMKRCGAWIQSKETVKIEHAVLLYRRRQPDRVAELRIPRVSEWHDEVQPVHTAAQENQHKRPAFRNGNKTRLGEADISEHVQRRQSAVGGKRTGGLEKIAAGNVHDCKDLSSEAEFGSF